jgi:hypothetical protein
MPRVPSTAEIRRVAERFFPETPNPSAFRAIARGAREYALLAEPLLKNDKLLDDAWDDAFAEFALSIAQMAADLHNGGFLWSIIEKRNRELFGTPLPFFYKEGDAPLPSFENLDVRRFQFFIYSVFLGIQPESPCEPDATVLRRLAEIAINLFDEDFKEKVPDTIREYLERPLAPKAAIDGAGYKRKLVWFSLGAYPCALEWGAFNDEHLESIRENTREDEIETRLISSQDDYISEHITHWGGLSLVEFFANTLHLDAEARADILSWRERHIAPFRVETVEDVQHLPDAEDTGVTEKLIVKNLLTDALYTILLFESKNTKSPFRPGVVVTGALQRWRDKWRWSGAQKVLSQIVEKPEYLKEFKEKFSQQRYVYDEKFRAVAEKCEQLMHENFVAFFGTDLAVFANADEYSKKMTKCLREYQRKLVAKRDKSVKTDIPEVPPVSTEQFSDRQAAAQMAVFSEIVGDQTVLAFHKDLVSALKCDDAARMDSYELDILLEVITDATFSAAFVLRVIEKYGDAGIISLFLAKKPSETTPEERKLLVNFLLRFFKGKFFYKRYPEMTMIE